MNTINEPCCSKFRVRSIRCKSDSRNVPIGRFSVVKLLHAGYVPRAVKVWETAYSCLFGVSCVEGFRSHCMVVFNVS